MVFVISRLEDAFNKGLFRDALLIIKNQKHLQQGLQLLELNYFTCRIYERLGKWDKAWQVFVQTEKKFSKLASDDPRAKLILLTTKSYLLWRSGRIKEGIQFVEENNVFIDKLTTNYKVTSQVAFYDNWLGLYYITICNFYLQHGEFEQAKILNEKSLAFYSNIGYELYKTKILVNFGEIHKLKGELDLAIENYTQASNLSNKNDPVTYLECVYNLGQIFFMMEKFETAVENYLLGKEIAESINNLVYQAKINYRLLIVYYYQKNAKEIENYVKTLHYLDTISSQNIYIHHLVRIGEILFHLFSETLKDEVDAQEILKTIYTEPIVDFESNFFVMILLTESYIREYKTFYNSSSLIDIREILNSMLYLASKAGSITFILETKLLQAKVELITGNIEESEKFFNFVQSQAQEKGLQLISKKSQIEYEKFKDQIILWKQLSETNLTHSNLRLEFSEIREYLNELKKLFFE